ncbi:MAG TPA: alcohol dehydrogenase catalytic domain-containing protein [Kineosporiaceae bacterium]
MTTGRALGAVILLAMTDPPRNCHRAARLTAAGDIRAVTEPVPRPSPGEQLVRVTAVGICGSDLHWYTEGGIGDAVLSHPLVIGHEAAGVIVGGPRDGERVAIDPALPCGRCELCRAGHRNLCPSVAFCGHGGTDGALRQYLTWPDPLLHPLPDTLSDADGAMLEPLGVGLHAVDLAHQRLAAGVAVIGCGPIGLGVVQLARAAGAVHVIAVDPLPHRAEAALRLGAHSVLPAEPEAFGRGLADLTGGRGVDVAYEAAGTDEAVGLAVTAAMPGARVVLAGIPEGDQTRFAASVARRKGLTLVTVRRMKEVYPRTIALASRGMVDLSAMVTHTFALQDVDAAFRTAASREGLKVIVEPGR